MYHIILWLWRNIFYIFDMQYLIKKYIIIKLPAATIYTWQPQVGILLWVVSLKSLRALAWIKLLTCISDHKTRSSSQPYTAWYIAVLTLRFLLLQALIRSCWAQQRWCMGAALQGHLVHFSQVQKCQTFLQGGNNHLQKLLHCNKHGNPRTSVSLLTSTWHLQKQGEVDLVLFKSIHTNTHAQRI